MPGPLELGLILLVIVLLFGAQRIPEIMKGMGQGLREFRKEMKDTNNEAGSKKSDEHS